MKNLFKLLQLFLMTTILHSGCKKDNDENPPVTGSRYAYVINEGVFGSGDGSVSRIDIDSGKVTEDIFKTVNSFSLGDVVQSMTVNNNIGYIVVNNSKKVEVVNMPSFTSVTTISGFASPRFLLPVSSEKAYVSDWSDNNIKILNLTNNTITGTIPTGNGPEQMALINNEVYVTNVGGFGDDSIVTIINVLTNTVDSTLLVGVNPNSLITDINGKVWVLCGGTLGSDFTGGTADDIGGKLIRINPATNSIEVTFDFGQFEHPVKMKTNKNKGQLFFLNGADNYTGNITVMDITSSTLPATSLINKSFYGLGIDPETENIYGGFSPSFSQKGFVFRYTSSGNLIDSLHVGAGPNSILF